MATIKQDGEVIYDDPDSNRQQVINELVREHECKRPPKNMDPAQIYVIRPDGGWVDPQIRIDQAPSLNSAPLWAKLIMNSPLHN